MGVREARASETVAAQYERIELARDSARRELRALDAVLAHGEGGPPACSALLRAWRAIAVLDAAVLGKPPQPDQDRSESRVRSDLASSSNGCTESPSQRLEAAAAFPAPPCSEWPSVRAILRQRHALVGRYVELGNRIRASRRRGVPWSRLAARAALAAVVVIAIALARRAPVWRVEYFRTKNLVDPAASDFAVQLGGDWGEGSPHVGVPADDFSSRWETCLSLPRPTDIVFALGSDDGSRLFVDGACLVDQWRGQEYKEATAQVRLGAGVHALRVEHFDGPGAAILSLHAQFDGRGPFSQLPSAMLRAPRGIPTSCAQ
ncbi:MAG: PA14 domain-containing protein [Polyangiaceae bacterium]